MRSLKIWRALSGLAILASAVFLLSITSQADDKSTLNATQNEKRKIEIGQQISPVPLNFSRKDADTVHLGSYIVNATGGCSDCHTVPNFAPGGNPFLGQPKQFNSATYLGGGAPFGPTITSRNLTPDVTGKPAGMTLSDFIQVMRTGDDLHDVHGPGVPLLVMPWPVYQSMTDRDLMAVYAFLSAIPCLEGFPGIPGSTGPRCR